MVQAMKNCSPTSEYDMFEIRFDARHIKHFMLARKIINNYEYKYDLKNSFRFDDRTLVVTRRQFRDIVYLLKQNRNNPNLTVKRNTIDEMLWFFDYLEYKII